MYIYTYGVVYVLIHAHVIHLHSTFVLPLHILSVAWPSLRKKDYQNSLQLPMVRQMCFGRGAVRSLKFHRLDAVTAQIMMFFKTLITVLLVGCEAWLIGFFQGINVI